jgi:hypothetical protein
MIYIVYKTVGRVDIRITQGYTQNYKETIFVCIPLMILDHMYVLMTMKVA